MDGQLRGRSSGLASALRVRALEAGLRLVGEQGLRALTHARVDAEAGLPRGSTSNYFRTRRALLDGLVGYLADLERQDFADVPPPRARSEVEASFLAMLQAQVGPFRHRTIARYTLFVDAAHDEQLLTPLLVNRRGFEEWASGILETLGARSPLEATAFFMAALDGLLLHRLTVDPGLDLGPHLARALDAALI